MGITGLLPFLDKATRPCHVSEFRGGTVAVDSYCFLHKGANACAEQLARGEDNRSYVYYCIKYVKMLLSYDIHPIMVFDGRNLPAKAETEAKRRESRKKAKQRAAELLRLGKPDEARTYLKQCIDITPQMAHNLIQECRNLKVDCIVAPYESDAQMAYFNMKGIAECIITEDSDLVLFGGKKVLFKLDLAGAGRLVEADKIYLAMKMRPDQFTFDKFRFMCILSGCDYVNSLNGIGLKKAEKFLKLTAETDPEIFLNRLPRYLNMRHLVVTDEYKRNVLIAHATFLHQVVFDPYKKKMVHLIDPEMTGTNPEYLINSGEKFDNNKAFQVAIGNLNPYSFEKMDDWSPSEETLHQYSIWSGVYKKRISIKQEKQLRKAEFQKCMSSNPIPHSISAGKEEQNMIEEDNEIDKELFMYTRKLEVKEENTVDEEQEPSPEPQKSPIIKKNPFLKKKKLSKFPKTESSEGVIVKSRFFASDCSVKNEMTTSTNSDSQQYLDESPINKGELYKVEEFVKENSEQKFTPTSIISQFSANAEILKSCENTSETDSKKRCFGEVSKVEEIDDVIEINDSEQFTIKKDKITPPKVTSPTENDPKKRKLGTCKTVGLRKKPPGQKTLHTFFNKLKNID